MRDAVVGLAVMLAGCYSPSPAVGVPCSADGLCPSGQVCDQAQVPPVCVAAVVDAAVVPPDAFVGCMTNTDCTGMTPICETATHACRACVADSECGAICTEYDGQCFPDSKAVFVDPAGTDGGNCTRNAPCRTFAFAMAQLTNQKRIVHVADGTYSSSGSSVLAVTNTAGRIVIDGDDANPDGAFLAASSNGTTNPPVVTTAANTDVVIEGITIRNGGNDGLRNSGDLLLDRVAIINNAGRGVLSNPNLAALHIWNSIIASNGNEGINAQKGPVEILRSVIARNTNGGIFITANAAATITGCMIVHNGSTGSNYGGLRFQNLGGMAQSLSFLTIADNLAGGASVSGVTSDVTLAVDDSILADNNNASTGVDQLSSGCTASYSLFTTTPPIGTGNLQASPDFVDAAADNFHIQATSMAKDAADPAATVRVDLDGDPRPSGAGFEIGADELP